MQVYFISFFAFCSLADTYHVFAKGFVQKGGKNAFVNLMKLSLCLSFLNEVYE